MAIFDADFVPAPSFLRRTIPFLLADSRLGAVQARWGHLNAADSSLTGAQAIALDKHFAVEQLVRHRADCFPKFNGSAGVWRRACIADAGGPGGIEYGVGVGGHGRHVVVVAQVGGVAQIDVARPAQRGQPQAHRRYGKACVTQSLLIHDVPLGCEAVY